MSYPSFAPGAMPRPAAKARPATPKKIAWGWLEWFLIAQTFIPGLLFVPGISPIRVVLRVAVFGLAMVAWFSIIQSGRTRAGAGSFTANTWLKITAGWLLLLVLNPSTNSLASGLAQAILYIAVFSPAFWAHSALASQKQVGRLMAILLFCNGFSAMIGLGQVFRPGTFNPPVIPGIQSIDGADTTTSALTLSYQDDYGNRIIRPCGLTDQVGAAAGAGSIAAMVGLAYALRPLGMFRRLVCLGFAFCGVAVIYYSQVRMILMMLVIGLALLVLIFIVQRNFGYATLLGALSAVMIAGALSWVMATSGKAVVERFLGLASDNFADTYARSNRGGFIAQAVTVTMWESPIGSGLGWWGTIYGAFGNKSVPNRIWVEVMIPGWIVDGGIPLLVLYVGAICVAMANTLRIALRSRDPDLKFWAAVVLASNLSVLATCFSYVTFVTSIGLQFWLLSAVVHAADVRVRATSTSSKPRPVGPPPYPPGPPPPPPLQPAQA